MDIPVSFKCEVLANSNYIAAGLLLYGETAHSRNNLQRLTFPPESVQQIADQCAAGGITQSLFVASQNIAEH